MSEGKNSQKPLCKRKSRNSGSTFMVLCLGIALAILATCAIGYDVTHNIATRTAMQNAADAAALAGAASLVQQQTAPYTASSGSVRYGDATSISTDSTAAASTQAVSVAGTNLADGRLVSATSTPGCTVTPSVIQPGAANSAQNCPSNNGECQVNASISIQNFFAKLFGHASDSVNVQSVATAYSTMMTVNGNGVFPLAVSLDTSTGHSGAAGSNDYDLYTCKIGTTETFTLTEPCANAAWTSLNTRTTVGNSSSSASNLNTMIDSALGINYSPSAIPAQTVGEVDKNSVSGIDLLGDMQTDGSTSVLNVANSSSPEYQAMLNQTIILPVVAGDPPYRNVTSGTQYQPQPQARPLLGFIGFHVTSMGTTSNGALEYIQGTIVKALVKGTPGIVNPVINVASASFNSTLDAALDNLSPGMIQLGASNQENDVANAVGEQNTDVFAANSGALGGGVGGSGDDTSGTAATGIPQGISNLMQNGFGGNAQCNESVMLGGQDNGVDLLNASPSSVSSSNPFVVDCLYHDESPIGSDPVTDQNTDGQASSSNVRPAPMVQLFTFNNGSTGSPDTTGNSGFNLVDSSNPNDQPSCSNYSGTLSVGQSTPASTIKVQQGDDQYETILTVSLQSIPSGPFVIMITTHDGDNASNLGRHLFVVSNPTNSGSGCTACLSSLNDGNGNGAGNTGGAPSPTAGTGPVAPAPPAPPSGTFNPTPNP